MPIPFQVSDHVTLLGSEYFNLNLVRGEIKEKITEKVTERFSRGFLQFFPPEDHQRLWRLLIQRTLEYSGCKIEGR